MSDRHELDMDAFVDALTDEIEAIIDDRLEDAVRFSLQDALPEALQECLVDFDFVLKDGTVVQPRPRMKLLSPDGSKLLLSYGGLRVDGRSLMVQTAISRWEDIACYPDRAAAIEALKQVRVAMEAGAASYELI